MLEPGQSTDPQVLAALTVLVHLFCLRSLVHLLDLGVLHLAQNQLLGQSPRRNRRHQLTAAHKPTGHVSLHHDGSAV